ncbi:HD-GYP domain-containing protein, partial [Chloroflexota bacterium]
ERYDGKGYPKGVKGKNIPLGARLVAVANAFDVMITSQPYHAALTVDEAINELLKHSGTQFCPQAVETFVAALKEDFIQLVADKDETANGEKETAHPEEGGDTGETTGKDIQEIADDIFAEDVQLLIPSVTSAEQVSHFKECLKRVSELKIGMVGWSEDEGHSIAVSIKQPVPLIKILQEIPAVRRVEEKDGNIVVTLDTTDTLPRQPPR